MLSCQYDHPVHSSEEDRTFRVAYKVIVSVMSQDCRTRTVIACRSFSHAAPRVWNDLPKLPIDIYAEIM